MSSETTPPPWPADIIHVNEDGWVLINRGRADAIALGMRLFVVGNGSRELRDLFATVDGGERPVVLRTRRTYELLEIVHVEEHCAVAVAARAPVARRPQFFHGPGGELLVWIPLPADYTWPSPGSMTDLAPDSDADDENVEDDNGSDANAPLDQADDGSREGSGGAESAASAAPPDAPPEHGYQEDERWEQALPLNGVSVGDLVIPAVPVATPLNPTAATSTADAGAGVLGQKTWDKSYDWMPPKTDS